MSPADRSLLKRLGGRPLFRCSGGWRRGDIKITTRKASELQSLGALRRTSTRRGELVLLPVQNVSRVPQAVRAWWVD